MSNNNTTSRDNDHCTNRSSLLRRQPNRNNWNKNHQYTKFKGWIDGLEQSVFNIEQKNSYAFNISMKNLGEYIVRSIPNASEFLKAFNPENIGFEPLSDPDDPGSTATLIDIKKWKTRRKNIIQRISNVKKLASLLTQLSLVNYQRASRIVWRHIMNDVVFKHLWTP